MDLERISTLVGVLKILRNAQFTVTNCGGSASVSMNTISYLPDADARALADALNVATRDVFFRYEKETQDRLVALGKL